MTYTEFLEEVQKIEGWCFPEASVYSRLLTMKAEVYSLIRQLFFCESAREITGLIYFCPIAAVYYAKTGIIINPNGYNDAGQKLGLTVDDTVNIVYAADAMYDLAPAIKLPRIKSIRQDLLNACGLTE